MASPHAKRVKPSSPLPSWEPLQYHTLFGIVGGLGPMATVDFSRALVDSRVALFRAMTCCPPDAQSRLESVLAVSTSEWTLAQVEQVYLQTSGRSQLLDQDHIPLLIAQATTVPPRPTFILGQTSVDPTPALVSVAAGLVNAGATHLAVVCNTAHYFWDDVARALQGRAVFLSMPELSVLRARKKLLPNPPVAGLLATAATLKSGIFTKVASQHSLVLVSPLDLADGQAQYELVHEVIFGPAGIKSGFDKVEANLAGMRQLLLVCLRLYEEKGASVIILGCTELPLLLTNTTVKAWASKLLLPEQAAVVEQLYFVDPNLVLADEVLKLTLLSRESLS